MKCPKYDDPELRSRLAPSTPTRAPTAGRRPAVVAAAWCARSPSSCRRLGFDTIARPLASPVDSFPARPAACRRGGGGCSRDRRSCCCGHAPGSTTEASDPRRPVPTTVPDVVPKTHAIVLTPSTGLRDGQPIRLTGRHFVVGVGHGGCGASILYVTSARSISPCRAVPRRPTGINNAIVAPPAGTAAGDHHSQVPLRSLREAKVAGAARRTAARRLCGLPVLGRTAPQLARRPRRLRGRSRRDRSGVRQRLWRRAVAVRPHRWRLRPPQVTVTPNTDLKGQPVTIHVEDAWPRSIDNEWRLGRLAVLRPGDAGHLQRHRSRCHRSVADRPPRDRHGP